MHEIGWGSSVSQKLILGFLLATLGLIVAGCGIQQVRLSVDFENQPVGQAIDAATLDQGPYAGFMNAETLESQGSIVAEAGTQARFPAPEQGRAGIIFHNLGNPTDLPAGSTPGDNSVHDYLDPGPNDFEFGADVILDANSLPLDVDLPGDQHDYNDNGNNVMQRNRAGNSAPQYKLELDDRGGIKAICVVKPNTPGGPHSVSAQAVSGPIQTGTRYRITCSRSGDNVTVTVQNLDGGADPASGTGSVALGHLEFPIQIPLTVGAKFNTGHDGNNFMPDSYTLANDSDQFNGAIDNVFVQIDP